MSKFFSDRPNSLRSTRSGKQSKLYRWQPWLVTAGFMVSLIVTMGQAVQAQQKPANAPPQIKALFTGIDAAANSQNARSVVEFFSPNFTHSDGLNRQTLQESLAALWKRYPNLNYRTELKSWRRDGGAIVVDTLTYITGVKKEGDREFKLNSQLEARQRVENQKIVNQEVLNERSQITSGSNPPTLKINLPEQVRGGQEFTFDAIVQEPLGDDLLMGTALEEAIKPEGFIKTTTANLEPLPSGGIFKVGRAPNNAEQHWLSAVVVRHDGITMVTQRLRIQPK
jgi:hypothetical protein